MILNDLKWPTLQSHRKYHRLILLFKVVNHLQLMPEQYLPSPARLTSTRSNHPCKFYHIKTSCDTYKFSFFPKTIPEWNSLQINNINNLSLTKFKLVLTKATPNKFSVSHPPPTSSYCQLLIFHYSVFFHYFPVILAY